MYWLILGALFLQPIHNRARAKGLPAGRLMVLAGAAGATTFLVSVFVGSWGLFLLSFLLPAAVLGGILLTSPRAGAPGPGFLQINLACPECGGSNRFARSQEGTAALCAHCGEIVRLPVGPDLPREQRRHQPKPTGVEGLVAFEWFGCREEADQIRAVLEQAGIASAILSDDAGGLLGPLAGNPRYRLQINIQDWEAALAILDELQPGIWLPAPPVVPHEEAPAPKIAAPSGSCWACGKAIHRQALTCPHCGQNLL